MKIGSTALGLSLLELPPAAIVAVFNFAINTEIEFQKFDIFKKNKKGNRK